MALSVRIAVLLATSAVTSAVRINVPWPSRFMRHCIVNDTEELCWEGKAGEGRLHAICGGDLISGKCASSGYPCDVSGVSWERFTWFLGLKVYKPMVGEVCVPYLNDRNMKSDMMMATLQKNGVCPPLLEAVSSLRDDGLKATREVSRQILECRTLTPEKCADLLTGKITGNFASRIYDRLAASKLHAAVTWAETVLQAQGVAEAIDKGEHVGEIPDEVREYVEQMNGALDNKNVGTIAKRMMQDWGRVTSFVLVKFPQEYLTGIVTPAILSLLEKFPALIASLDKDKLGLLGVEEVNVDKAAEFVTDEMSRFEDILNGKVNEIMSQIEGLCAKM